MHAFDQACCCFALSFEDHCFTAGGAAVHQRFTDLYTIRFSHPYFPFVGPIRFPSNSNHHSRLQSCAFKAFLVLGSESR